MVTLLVPLAGKLIKAPLSAVTFSANMAFTETFTAGIVNDTVCAPEVYHSSSEVATVPPPSSVTENPAIKLFPLGVRVRVTVSPIAASDTSLLTVPPPTLFNTTVCDAEASITDTVKSKPLSELLSSEEKYRVMTFPVLSTPSIPTSPLIPSTKGCTFVLPS